MVYHVIGLMSGSSLDGLDICFAHLHEARGKWKYEIVASNCIAYTSDLAYRLLRAAQLDVSGFLLLHTDYGRWIGERINDFIEQYDLSNKVHFIASHGHTVYHNPKLRTTSQIGDGATIAATTGLPVISDLRALDVALGGQGAPIVPIGDKLLFGAYDYWLNIGGIVNLTVRKDDQLQAFDVCTGNQALNILAQKEGQDFDKNGLLAKRGVVLTDLIGELNSQEYFRKSPPKSLSNDEAKALVFPALLESPRDNLDLLRTMVQHIAEQVALAASRFPHGKDKASMLVTGGGAFNDFLIETLSSELLPYQIEVVVPGEQEVKYKEALVMALIGALRWREETNVLASVTGAQRDSISGALWMGHSYQPT
ncbi:MAG: anhydro-N-acetylmuramic acid kinase [Bacteroidetes bacterium]|nr:anhydro-N-acetylmuramic acid kinase [Bacteroidota bacterium]